ncbi:hypothetical protein [Paenibacillus popilliae]|uniref:Uncharacterized protein n=1 Tax=Paenibacillus popilliae TaxID=78057 RepID=A0ABY3AJ26_PAEPP|nr:hypothetical protein [Paenibacillus sp. SDF0028]TQR41755.1 hypothetical protein C7Y44_24870 [Paenibacillus sp. SDF0028]
MVNTYLDVNENNTLIQREYNQYPLFLKERYNVVLEDKVTVGDFIQAVAIVLQDKLVPTNAVFGTTPDELKNKAIMTLYQNGILDNTDIKKEDILCTLEAISIATRAAGFKELAYTYPEQKINKALYKLNLTASTLPLAVAQELSVVVDLDIIPKAFYQEIKNNTAPSALLMQLLLIQILTCQGLYKYQLGRVSDANIYTKIFEANRRSGLIYEEGLYSAMDNALNERLITGYCLKDKSYAPNFIKSLTITCRHDDLKHAIQLIGLLRSENIDANVQYEPTTSAFVYMDGWGKPKETDDYKVVKIKNGDNIAYCKEYELHFEFDNIEDKTKFHFIIDDYAKKNIVNESGLIYDSWWVPLYYSTTELSEYEKVTNILMEKGRISAETITFNDVASKVLNNLEEQCTDHEITSQFIWINRPMCNYMNGGYK